MKKSETITKIAPALLAAQKTMGDAKKDSKNPFFKSSYADLNSVREVATPALNAQGILILQPPTYLENGKNVVETVLLHESGEYISSAMILEVPKANMQDLGSAVSYARRYSLQSLLNIGAVDDDGEASMKREKPVEKGKEIKPTSFNKNKQEATPVPTTNGSAKQAEVNGDDW